MIIYLTYKYDNITDVVLMCLQLTLCNVLLEIHILCQHADLIPEAYLESCQLAKKSTKMRGAIWYHLYNLKNVKNIHGGVLLLVKLQVQFC